MFKTQKKGDNYRKMFQETGDANEGAWTCGQGLGMIDDIPTCKDLIESMVKECENIFNNRLQDLKNNAGNITLPKSKL